MLHDLMSPSGRGTGRIDFRALTILPPMPRQHLGRLDRNIRLYALMNLWRPVILTWAAVRARQDGIDLVEGAWAGISLLALARLCCNDRSSTSGLAPATQLRNAEFGLSPWPGTATDNNAGGGRRRSIGRSFRS